MCFFVVDHRCFTWGQTKQYDKTNNKLSRSHAILVFYVISRRCISNFKPQLRGSWLNFLSGVDGCISSSFMQWTIYPPRWGQQPMSAGTEETWQCFQYFFYCILFNYPDIFHKTQKPNSENIPPCWNVCALHAPNRNNTLTLPLPTKKWQTQKLCFF